MCVLLDRLCSHSSSASFSSCPVIPFSSRPKHHRYIIWITLAVVRLWKGSNNREGGTGHQCWRKCRCSSALMIHCVRKQLNSNTFMTQCFSSKPELTAATVRRHLSRIWTALPREITYFANILNGMIWHEIDHFNLFWKCIKMYLNIDVFASKY